MDYGEQTTGTRDEHYNLVSVLYHALSGADTCERYALDAETVGDERLAAFFRETQVMQSQIAERAKGLLGILEHRRILGLHAAGEHERRDDERRDEKLHRTSAQVETPAISL